MTTLLNDLQGQFGCALPLHHPRPRDRVSVEQADRDHVPRRDRRAPAGGRVPRGDAPPLLQGPRRGGPHPRPRAPAAPQAHTPRSETFRAPRTHPPGAGSIRDARTSRSAARASARLSRSTGRATGLPVTSPAACHPAPATLRRTPSRVEPDMAELRPREDRRARRRPPRRLGRRLLPRTRSRARRRRNRDHRHRRRHTRADREGPARLGPRPAPVHRLLQVAGGRRPPAPRLLADQRAQRHVAAGPAAPRVARARLSRRRADDAHRRAARCHRRRPCERDLGHGDPRRSS